MDKQILKDVKTVVEIEFDSIREANIIYNSINPELSFSTNDRSKTEMEVEKNIITITITSKDVVSLRASIHSYVRWIKLSTEILKI